MDVKQREFNKISTYVILIVLSLIAVFPIYWTIQTSLKARFLTFAIPPKWIFLPKFENYYSLFANTDVVSRLINSLIIGIFSTLLSVIMGSLAAFSFARLKIARKKDVMFWILSTRMIPPITTLIPLFLFFRAIGLYDTHFGVIMFYTAFNLPLVIWVMRSFIIEIPLEIEECAMIDGCSKWGVFWKITLPLTMPALFATGALSFILCWNEFIGALILTSHNAVTLPVLAMSFISAKGVVWGEMTAGATVIIVPVVIFVILFQKYLVKGLSFGMLK